MENVAEIRTGHRPVRGRAHHTIVSDQSPSIAPSPRIRNGRRILSAAWDGGPLTASDLIGRTGLTRATVLALCRDLAAAGWLEEVDDARAAGLYAKGRPALRYAFQSGVTHVIGVDAGQHTMTAAVTDLHGRELARIRRAVDPEGTAETRRQEFTRLVDDLLEAGSFSVDQVAAIVVGVPAPVDQDGQSPSDGADNFWPRMNPDLISACADRHWDAVVDNDANLAALAEAVSGANAGVRGYATLLSGERFGAGIVVDGQLLRGTRGGVGEMRVLNLVGGVDAPDGLTHRAREEVRVANAEGRLAGSALANLGVDGVEAQHVFAAARCGDPLAQEIVDTLAARLVPVVQLLSGLLDLDRIIIAGAVAASARPVLQRTRELMADDSRLSWAELVASEHGEDVVLHGAVYSAIALVKTMALLDE